MMLNMYKQLCADVTVLIFCNSCTLLCLCQLLWHSMALYRRHILVVVRRVRMNLVCMFMNINIKPQRHCIMNEQYLTA